MFRWLLTILAFLVALHIASDLHLPSFVLTLLATFGVLGFILACVGTFFASINEDRAAIKRLMH